MRALAPSPPRGPHVVVPIARLDRAALHALAVARSISDDVTAIHVTGDDRIEEMRIRERWRHPLDGIALEIIETGGTPVDALLAYLDAAAVTTTVVVPEFVPRPPWLYVLQNLGALVLKLRLLRRANTVVISAPYRA